MKKAPIHDMLKKYSGRNIARFHMPGHKGRGSFCGSDIDVTELGTTDNLHNPGQAIQKTQERLGALKNAKSHLLVGGSTAGIHAMVLCSKDGMIIPKNSHKAVFDACMLYKKDCIIVEPEFDISQQMYRNPVDVLLDTHRNNSNMDVFITSPDYYGNVNDLSKFDVNKLYVDSAHGAHFGMSESLPPIQRGNMFVESAHKTLGAPTQSAWISCINPNDDQMLTKYLKMVQSSSPSFILLDGLDIAISQMEFGWDEATDNCKLLGDEIDTIKGYRVLTDAWSQKLGYITKDITRLVIDVVDTGYSGYDIGELLSAQDIEIEMSDNMRIVLIVTPYNTKEDFDRLISALSCIKPTDAGKTPILDRPPISKRVFELKSLLDFRTKTVRLEKSQGEIAAVQVGAYPPGTPVLLPGDRMDKDILDWLLKTRSNGCQLFGCNEFIEVIR